MDSCKPRSKPQEPVRVMFQGLFNSGKTSVMLQLHDGKFLPEERSHIGGMELNINFEGTELAASSPHRREDYKRLIGLHYMWFDALICVIDSADTDELDDALEDLETFFSMKQKEMRTKVLMVLANKQDLDKALPVKIIEEKVMEKVSAYERTMTGKTVFVAGCSAKTRKGLDKAMSQFIEKIHQKKFEAPVIEKKPAHRFFKKLADILFH